MRLALSVLAVAVLSGCGHGQPEGNTGAVAVNNFAAEMRAKQLEQEWAQREAIFMRERELSWVLGDTFAQTYPQFAKLNDDFDLPRDRGESPTQEISGGGFRFGSEKSFAGVELNGAYAWQQPVASTEPTNQIVLPSDR